MDTRRLGKADIAALLEAASARYDTFAPLREESGDVLWSRVGPGSFGRVTLDDEPAILSPKGLFFPQSERLFSFGPGGIVETAERSPKLLFGLKSCDLAGLLFSDGFFSKDFADRYYLSRAADRIVVTKGCLAPPRPGSCFCASAGTGPFATSGFDLQLVDLGDDYEVEIGSPAGLEFVTTYSEYFAQRDESGAARSASASAEAKARARAALEPGLPFGQALELMKTGDFQAIYDRLGERCIYCGACLYVCPTCTCFNVADRRSGDRPLAADEGERLRVWDGCVFEGYTREASGHNPRASKAARTARRYEHKLRYDPPIAGRSGCVGCGRCLDSCPVGIGMSNFIREIAGDREES